jgi:hypothetical protein
MFTVQKLITYKLGPINWDTETPNYADDILIYFLMAYLIF